MNVYTAQMKTYLVGGAVRDQLLGLPVHERDWVVVGASIAEMLAAGYQQVGKDFPVFIHPKTGEEYALARTERKSGKGYTGFMCISDPGIRLEDDLLRRDLTINAIAQDEQGVLIDPYGGCRDIEQKILRHVSSAFHEDPLRVLRLARFAARFDHLGFTIAAETRELVRQMSDSGELAQLTPERVWKETEKALATDSPQVYFRVLQECGALKVLYPEIDTLFGIPQNAVYHPEVDTGLHTLMVLEQAALLSNSIAVRFAALTHDLGKGLTPRAQWPRHIGHENKGIVLVRNLCQRLKVPNDCRDLALLVSEHHLNCHRALELKPLTIHRLFKALDLYRRPERLAWFLLACEADAKGRTGFEHRDYPQKTYLIACFNATLAINAQNTGLGTATGKMIGELIDRERVQAIATIKAGFPPVS